jgi:HEAT repeat protein
MWAYIICRLMMSGFLQNLALDQISFWIGFVAGALGLWLLSKLVPALPSFAGNIRNRSGKARSSLISGNAERLRQETLRYVQGIHLASPLFALDEILIEPRVLAPPPQAQPNEDNPTEDILNHTIPYLPDWPELAARYSAHTLSLSEALSAGANLILIGGPGSGKSIALAHLVCQIVRREETASGLSDNLPVYVHVADLFPEAHFSNPPLEHILNAVHTYADSISTNRLESLLGQTFQAGRVLLLVDGLDEVPQKFHQEVVSFINTLLQEYPRARMVVTSSPENFSGMVKLGLIPVAMAGWNEYQYLLFIRKWSRSWFRHIRPTIQEDFEQIDPRLLNAWLLAEHPVITPIDATLKDWAVFAGDTVGPGYVDAIESYIWRQTNHLENSRPGLEDFALQMVASLEIALDLKRARGWEAEFESDQPGTDSEADTPQKTRSKRGKKLTRKLPGVLPDLLEQRLLVQRATGHLGFSHPLIMAYLASAALADAPVSHFLSNQPEWTGKSLTMLFLAASRDISPEVSEILSQDDDPLLRRPLMIGRWLRYAPQTATWPTQVMRYLAAELQRENIALGLRARLLSTLLQSGDPGVSVLLRQISHTSIDDLRHISALGMGYLLDPQALGRLSELLTEPEQKIFQSACLALVKIGNKQSFEVLGSALINGSDEVRRSVAESLALDPTEGQDILKEASQMEDLLVRRAAVYGLAQIDQPWAKEILKKLALEDKEWIVRSAATQIIEADETISPSVPQPIPPLHETQWLIAFGDERGTGIAPGKPADNLLLAALGEGSPEQQRAALVYLQLNPNPEALPHIYELLEHGIGNTQQVAFETLWYYAAEGLDIQSPVSHT